MPNVFAVVIAVLFSATIAIAAWRAGTLSRSGTFAATVVGTVALCTGPAWGMYLVSWFIVTAALGRLGRTRKARHVRGVVEKGGARDAPQVLANGGVFTGCALLTWWLAGPPASAVSVAAAAALAAAGADTWATEAGTWASGRAWSLRTWRWVPAGTSGAVTLTGSAALVVGALLWSGAAVLFGVVPASAWHALAVGGVAGAVADTLLGAWGQQRRWCPACRAHTEQRMHECGHATQLVGGARWLDNDIVNLMATVVGAGVAVASLR